MIRKPNSNANTSVYPLQSVVETIGTQVLDAVSAAQTPTMLFTGSDPNNVIQAENEHKASITTSTFGASTTAYNLTCDQADRTS